MAKSTFAKIERISPLTDSIIEVVLLPNEYIEYTAGQYLQIQCNDSFLSFSIANAPLGSHHYELHIRHDAQNLYHQSLFSMIKQQGGLNIRLPFGECHSACLSDEPIIFIAGGTGFAPIKAMIEQLLGNGDQRPFELYWGARSQSDLYMDEKVKQWQAHVRHFRYVSFLPSTRSKAKLVHQVIEHHPEGLQSYQFIIAGAFDMVFSVRDALLLAGAKSEQLYSDAFNFNEKG